MKLTATLSALLMTLGACADAGTEGPTGPGVEVNLAALNLTDVTYAQYTITVKDSGSNVVSQAQIDSTSYAVSGDPTTVRYVAPCDSTANDNTVTVSVDAITTGTGGSAQSLTASELPADQTQTVACTANQSTQVSFEFYALSSSEMGFFDVFIGTNIVYCSAKLDCATTPSFFPSSAGEVVLGFTCTADNAATADSTVLHMDDISIACGAAGTATITIDQTGNLPAGKISDATTPLIDGATVFRGEDLIGTSADNVYWNVAIGLTTAATGATCTLTTKGATTAGTTVPVDMPYVDWNVGITNGSAVSCTTHPLFGTTPHDGVSAAWPSTGTAATFLRIYYGNPTVFVTSGATNYTPGTAYNATTSPNTFASVADADTICGALATAAGLEGTYKAWLSDSTNAAKDHVALSPEALRLVSGAVVTLSRSSLLSGALSTAVSLDESGTGVTGAVWTGTKVDGTVATNNCTNWTSGGSGVTGTVGTQATDSTWTDNGTQTCDTAAHLICVQVQ